MPFPYEATYKEEDVVKLVGTIAPYWKTDAGQVPDLDVDKLFATLKRIVEGVRKVEKYETVDKDLQALLALATATSWFSEAQVTELDEWLEEVASPEEEDWMKSFPEEETQQAVLTGLGAHTAQITIDKVGKAIMIEYEGGNYGQGRHDGNVRISDEDLRIYDSRFPGQYMYSTDELPSSTEDLEWCLKSSNWDWGWEEEEH